MDIKYHISIMILASLVDSLQFLQDSGSGQAWLDHTRSHEHQLLRRGWIMTVIRTGNLLNATH